LGRATPEFDTFAVAYEELLRDPIRDRFTRGTSGFFCRRKCDLICDHFRRRRIDTRQLSYLDLGCGRGELLELLQERFRQVAGCDPSARMIESGRLRKSVPRRVQGTDGTIPFGNSEFDFVSAVCVYHHVPPAHRAALTAEVERILKPGGTFVIIEHNPYNPVTRRIVSRTPVDADAVLLPLREARDLALNRGLTIKEESYFLYLPEAAYLRMGGLESALRRIPLGGQYAVFAGK
jgi:SAM-dependent methyltransferase